MSPRHILALPVGPLCGALLREEGGAIHKEVRRFPIGVYEVMTIEVQSLLMFWRATWRLSELKTLLASTNRTASVLSLPNASLEAWTAASAPAI